MRTNSPLLLLCSLSLGCSAQPRLVDSSGTPGDSAPSGDSASPEPDTLAPVAIPAQEDWTRQGLAIEAGEAGSWDARLYGQISPSTVLKKDGRWLLYYVGADGDRSTDGGPRHRALGVATSEDGIRFTKHPGNPVLDHLPHGNEEEGVFSAGVTTDGDGRVDRSVALYYAAIHASDSTTESVQGYVALATSSDGLHFEDQGYVLAWDDPSVWGYGDELFPLGALRTSDSWFVYYGAKGHEASWDLGIAWGASATGLSSTAALLVSGDVIGGCDPVPVSEDELALFVVRDFEDNLIEVRLVPRSDPGALGDPVRTYSAFEGAYRHTTVLLDRETSTWFMYQSTDREEDGNHVVVRSAPMVTE